MQHLRALLLDKMPYAMHLARTRGPSFLNAADVTPTPTDTGLLDPDTIMARRESVFALIKSARYTEVVDDEQQQAQDIHVNVTGDATCAPYLFAKVVGTEEVLGTSQKSTQKARFEQYKKQGWANTSKTKGKWAKAKPSSFRVLGLTIDNPLECGSSSSSSSSNTGTTSSPCGNGIEIKDLNNQGQLTFNGKSVWDVRATIILFDQNCDQAASGTLDYLVSTAHYLPVQYKATLTDPAGSETFTITETMKDFGAKIKRHTIKVGSKTP